MWVVQRRRWWCWKSYIQRDWNYSFYNSDWEVYDLRRQNPSLYRIWWSSHLWVCPTGVLCTLWRHDWQRWYTRFWRRYRYEFHGHAKAQRSFHGLCRCNPLVRCWWITSHSIHIRWEYFIQGKNKLLPNVSWVGCYLLRWAKSNRNGFQNYSWNHSHSKGNWRKGWPNSLTDIFLLFRLYFCFHGRLEIHAHFDGNCSSYVCHRWYNCISYGTWIEKRL